jgi:hypothetical protein
MSAIEGSSGPIVLNLSLVDHDPQQLCGPFAIIIACAPARPDEEVLPSGKIRPEYSQLRRASNPVAFGLRYQPHRVFRQQITIAN